MKKEEKRIFTFEHLSTKDKETLRKAFQNSKGKFLALTHPFFTGSSKRIPHYIGGERMPEKIRELYGDYLETLNKRLKNIRMPLIVFSEYTKTEALKEIFKGMNLKVPIVFIRTDTYSPDLQLKRETIPNYLKKSRIKNMRTKLKNLGAEQALISGELSVLTETKNKTKINIGCAPSVKKLFSGKRHWCGFGLTGPIIKTRTIPKLTFPGPYAKKKRKK